MIQKSSELSHKQAGIPGGLPADVAHSGNGFPFVSGANQMRIMPSR